MYLQHQSSISATPQGQATDLLSLACLLSEPPKGRSSIQVAEGLLEAFECPRGIHRASDPELRLHGLGDTDIGHLRAAFALADSALLQRLQSRPLFDQPDAVAAYVEHRYFSTSQEKMGVLFLNTRNRLLSEEVLFVGTLTRAAVEPRPILKRALLLDACTMLLWHSHPSGAPSLWWLREQAEELRAEFGDDAEEVARAALFAAWPTPSAPPFTTPMPSR
jgi:DNA repair protein RadC